MSEPRDSTEWERRYGGTIVPPFALPVPLEQRKPSRWPVIVAVGVVVAGAVILCAGVAMAAMEGLTEPGHELRHVRGWSVTIYARDPEVTGWAHRRLSGYFEDRRDCERVRARMVPSLPGGRLRCDATDELMLVPVTR